MATRAGLKRLNEVGLKRLILRLLGRELKVQAARLYWHFKSKEELIDEMATILLAQRTLATGRCGRRRLEWVSERPCSPTARERRWLLELG